MSITVLQVLPELESGGVERGTVEVAKALIKAGHNSVVISAGGKMVKELEQCGAKHIQCAIGRKNPLTIFHALTLRQFLIKNDIDVIDARSRLPAWIVFLALQLLPEAKRPVLITTVHGSYSVSKYSAIMMQGDHIVAVSDFIKQYILKNYPEVDEQSITVIPRGVSSKQYFPRFKPDADWVQAWKAAQPALNDKFIITLPGRISIIKGQEDFLLIIKTLLERGLQIHGLIVGGAGTKKKELMNRLKQKSETLGVSQHVSFLGNRQDLREIMACSDLMLSLTKKPESFGRTIIEAIALGKPVFAYDHGGASEILTKCFPFGKVPANDKAEMCQRIEAFINDPSPKPDQCPFTLESMLKETLCLYEHSARQKVNGDKAI